MLPWITIDLEWSSCSNDKALFHLYDSVIFETATEAECIKTLKICLALNLVVTSSKV